MSASTSILAATDVHSPPVLRSNALDECLIALRVE